MTPAPGKRPVRIPRRTPQITANDEKRSIGCLLPSLLFIVAVVVLGFFAQRQGYVDFRKILEKFGPKQHQDAEIIDPSLHIDDQKPQPKPEPEPVVTNVVFEPIEPPPPPKKTATELKAEADAAQKALDLDIAKARETSGKSLPSFAGIKFGDVLKDPPISLEPLVDDRGTNGNGFCYLMFGPRLAASFRKFGNQPTVCVTPLTRKIFRIEFAQKIDRQPGWKLNPETTNLVATLSAKISRKPFSLDVEEYPLSNHEFVFPIGETTMTVGEYGGEQLKLVIEHAGLRSLAVEESAGFRKEVLAKKTLTKPLSADTYPNSGMAKFGHIRMKKGTPKAFCGIVFGSLPPYSATVTTPASSADPTAFFIDYRKSKCKPFMNFDHGKAELSTINGSVLAVHLFSNSPDEGLTSEEHFDRARQAIEHKFETKPASAKGDGHLQELTYAVGSLEITLGPDPAGGFRLSAVNTTLKKVW